LKERPDLVISTFLSCVLLCAVYLIQRTTCHGKRGRLKFFKVSSFFLYPLAWRKECRMRASCVYQQLYNGIHKPVLRCVSSSRQLKVVQHFCSLILLISHFCLFGVLQGDGNGCLFTLKRRHIPPMTFFLCRFGSISRRIFFFFLGPSLSY
jgi:hypothetical protein